MAGLDANARERLLRESHVANDGLWFYAVHQSLGIDAANRLNAEVVSKFGALEMAKLMRLLGMTGAPDAEGFVTLLSRALELFVKDLFRAEVTREGSRVHLKVQRCFAYEGVRKAGLDQCYRCGPGQRLLGWIAGADVPVGISPEVGACQMARTGSCSYALELGALS